MLASNDKAVKEIQDSGKKAGAEEERTRLAGLTAAFPNDTAFISECMAKEGFSVTDAKAAKYDTLLAENGELQKKVTELTEKAKDPTVEFAASDKEDKGASKDSSGTSKSALEQEGSDLWNKSAALREEFNGNKAAFDVDWRHCHGEWRSKYGKK